MKEYILGNIFGITQVLIGHPFDTLKTNLQNSKDIKIFIKNPIQLYRGITYPLLMNSIGTSFLFGNYDYFYKQTNNRLIAGMLTGSISAVILTPFDYKKIQLQTKYVQDQSQLKNTVNIHPIKSQFIQSETLSEIFKKYYKGFAYTLSREITAIPIYFYSYHYLIEYTNPFIAGGIAGVNSWLFTYPIDTLKSRKQLYQSKTLKEMIKMGSLYNGLTITLIRAFVVNSSSFYIYDLIKKLHLQD
jgi:solute carrier family 25 carnitine/acylcarnitine transporter 20/29